MMKLEKYSMGCGDRFAREASAQLAAYEKIADDGVDVIPVWNKSNREHEIIGTEPVSVRIAADAAVEAAGWNGGWHVDADHINLKTVDRYIPSADFFTLDVADSIGAGIDDSDVAAFLNQVDFIDRPVDVPGLDEPILISGEKARNITAKYLPAVKEAGRIYRKITSEKNEGDFIAEVSMDETDIPQGPEDLLLILAAIAEEGIPAQTIAPRFCGRFNKGVDYLGDPKEFRREFEADVMVAGYAVKHFGLPENLKLSVHSGSDKFAIYPEIADVVKKHGVGVHVKTAGTNWLEEIIGLAESGGNGLELAKVIFTEAYHHREELCGPYLEVIDIQDSRLPGLKKVAGWDSETFVRSLRHIPGDTLYNPDFRQLIHVGYKVAAKMGEGYLNALEENREYVSRNVTENLYARHLKPLFGGLAG